MLSFVLPDERSTQTLGLSVNVWDPDTSESYVQVLPPSTDLKLRTRIFGGVEVPALQIDRKSTRLNSSHRCISYAVFCLKKKTTTNAHGVLDVAADRAGVGVAAARGT